MLKYLLIKMFLIPLGFVWKLWRVVQNFLFVTFFLLIFSGCFMVQPSVWDMIFDLMIFLIL